MTTMRFFMIGSWTEGMVHFKKIAPFVVSSESAVIQASVYRPPVGYPVLVKDGNSQIRGQLVEMNMDSTMLAILDTFYGVHPSDSEKGLHMRQKARVNKLSGEAEDVEVYYLNPKKLNSKFTLITDSEWKKSLAENPPLPETLSEKQREYILKLGAAKGRDIVPIQDLTLYRELMKLELIVDKGRRLALSSLGKEVFAHLN